MDIEEEEHWEERMSMAYEHHEQERLTDLIYGKKKSQSTFISFEFFPPKTSGGIETLFQNISELAAFQPLFVDFTWGAGGSTSDLTLDLCRRAIHDYDLTVNMHLTCTGLDLSQLDDVLNKSHIAGIVNILALRGDPPQGQDTWVMPENGLTSALELIRYIKKSKHANYFCVGTAGYPEGHPSSITAIDACDISSLTATEANRLNSYEDTDGKILYGVCKDDAFTKELVYLKEKVDAGAAFIITQMFFDVDIYLTFVTRCREINIEVPIIPGLMLIGSYPGFKRMTKLCRSRVPIELEKAVENLKSDAEALTKYGNGYAATMAKQLLELGAPGIHFYTLNSANQTIDTLGLINYAVNADSSV